MELNITLITSVIVAVGSAVFSVIKNNTSTNENEQKVNIVLDDMKKKFDLLKKEMDGKFGDYNDSIKDTNQSWMQFFDKTDAKNDKLQLALDELNRINNQLDKRLISLESKISVLVRSGNKY